MPKVYLHLPELAKIKRGNKLRYNVALPGEVNAFYSVTADEKLLEKYTIEELCLVCYFCLILGYSTIGDATDMLEAIPYDHQPIYAKAIDSHISPEQSGGIIKVFNDLVYLSNIKAKGRHQFEVIYVN